MNRIRSFLCWIAGVFSAALSLAMMQSYLLWGEKGLGADFFWPAFSVFLLLSLFLFAAFWAIVEILLPGPERSPARKIAWAAVALRISAAALIPFALTEWGASVDKQREGFLYSEAMKASHQAWEWAGRPDSAAAELLDGRPVSTDAPLLLGAFVYRAFSPNAERPLALSLLACFWSAVGVVIVFRMGERWFSRSIGIASALLAAVYPEAVLVGASFLASNLLSPLFAAFLFGLSIACRPAPEESARSRALGWLLAGTLGLLFFPAVAMAQFLAFAVVCLALLGGLREPSGRMAWAVAGLGVLFLLLVRILSALSVIPTHADPLLTLWTLLSSRTVNGMAGITSGGSTDLFDTLARALPAPLAVLVPGAYGLLQPFLPSLLGVRPAADAGSALWFSLNLLRAAGWYLVMPLALSGTLGILRPGYSGDRRLAALLTLLFWGTALTAAYRSFADQWDNPQFRTLALLPMCLLLGIEWVRQQETPNPHLIRIAIPFAAGVLGFSAWYALRSYAGARLPAIPSLVVIALFVGICAVGTAWLTRIRPPASVSAVQEAPHA